MRLFPRDGAPKERYTRGKRPEPLECLYTGSWGSQCQKWRARLPTLNLESSRLWSSDIPVKRMVTTIVLSITSISSYLPDILEILRILLLLEFWQISKKPVSHTKA